MLKVEIPGDIVKLKQQIAALEYQIKHDTNEKDREIHKQALEELKKRRWKHWSLRQRGSFERDIMINKDGGTKDDSWV